MEKLLKKSHQKLAELLEKKREATLDSFVMLETTGMKDESMAVMANTDENTVGRQALPPNSTTISKATMKHDRALGAASLHS